MRIKCYTHAWKNNIFIYMYAHAETIYCDIAIILYQILINILHILYIICNVLIYLLY